MIICYLNHGGVYLHIYDEFFANTYLNTQIYIHLVDTYDVWLSVLKMERVAA